MHQRKRGAVVLVSSASIATPVPFVGHHISSKAALDIAAQTLALELRASGIGVVEVIPGPVRTGMLAETSSVVGLPGIFASLPAGDPRVLARLIVRALEGGQSRVIYPRSSGFVLQVPGLGRWAAARVAARMDVADTRVVRGGSSGDELAKSARASAEPYLEPAVPPSGDGR
jgi:short-subunit dehydrogenase